MNAPKQSRRKIGAKKLEPIDWHEFANDAVLNGNMSTLYQRPPSEDSTAYASPEALVEIEKRGRPVQSGVLIDFEAAASDILVRPIVGIAPTVGPIPTVVLLEDAADISTVGPGPTVGSPPTADNQDARRLLAEEPDPAIPTVGVKPTVGTKPTVGPQAKAQGNSAEGQLISVMAGSANAPTVGTLPTVGMAPTVGTLARKVKPIRDVQDALTLAGQVLYKAMYGAPDGAKSKSCTKGYRQLAAETHLDKDTVRDLIGEFKDKGIVRETGTYDPDTRSAKTYEVLSYKAILQIWRDADLLFVTTGRQRPMFCTAQGEPLTLRPTVGLEPTVTRRTEAKLGRPTVGPIATALGERQLATEVIQALQQITGNPVDQEAADRLIGNCRTEAADCTVEEIMEVAWSKAFLCRSGKIENPIGFLITQVPKHFQREALQAYRENRRKELEAVAALATREEQRREEVEREIAEMEERQRVRSQIAERHRIEQGIDLKGLLQDSAADDVLQQWAKRMLKLGHRYHPRYD
jgi:hypothetical protein